MNAAVIIAKIRDRIAPTGEELRWFAAGLADGTVTDAQAGAFAMAVLLNGLDEAGRVTLTQAMRDSGKVLRWDLPGPVLDKHSTGGLGDCVSLVLAPALAVCGAYVPMISGRGLGHTGGTLDKLEAIPGYTTTVAVERLRDITGRLGCAIVSASGDIAPADRRLYAIRDISGTVESRDLITASILSKKLSAGLDALVLDVKQGSGAFMRDAADAQALARALVDTANGAGCATMALITDMNQPLVPTAGNALEVITAMEVLTGRGDHRDLHGLTCALGGEALALTGLAATPVEGAARIANSLGSGAAAERFGEMVAELGGPVDFVEHWPDRLPAAPVIRPVRAEQAGYVGAIDGRALGLGVVELGGGRRRESDKVNPSVGFSAMARLGTQVAASDELALIHAASDADAARAEATLRQAYRIDPAPSPTPDLIKGRFT